MLLGLLGVLALSARLFSTFSGIDLQVGYSEPLPNAFGENEDHYWDKGTPAKPLVELEMTRLSAAIRLKPSWWAKFNDQEVLARWREEALQQAVHMKESHVDYVLKELDGFAKLRDEESGAEVACYDRIWQSDTLVSPSLRVELVAGVFKLENVPDEEKDWHPRSNGQVLDLVHPSLYPIVYGRTLAYSKDSTTRDPSELAPIPPPGPPREDPFIPNYDHDSSGSDVEEDNQEGMAELNMEPEHYEDFYAIDPSYTGELYWFDGRGNSITEAQFLALQQQAHEFYTQPHNPTSLHEVEHEPPAWVFLPPGPFTTPIPPPGPWNHMGMGMGGDEKTGGDDESMRMRSTEEFDDQYALSRQFQWLPTDFKVSDDGKTAKSLGYINNLHPDEHADLHSTIDKLVAAYIPLFERVLTDSIPKSGASPDRTLNQYSYGPSDVPEPDSEQFEDEEEFERRYQEWADQRPIILPDVPAGGYEVGSLERRATWYSLSGKTIQVIVKLANIHLTAEKPEYPGGSWHIEGMKNEGIAVSGIYYYDEENISESRLAFRTAAAIPGVYEQNDERGCRLTWGINRDEPCVNDLGSIATLLNRAIAFPNIYQHRVSPFQLMDKTKPGHRKIFALFLVDPAVSKPSTTIVPPQQKEWRAAGAAAGPKLREALGSLSAGGVDSPDGSMTREEAEKYRLELMDERTLFVRENDQKFFSVPFSLCEH